MFFSTYLRLGLPVSATEREVMRVTLGLVLPERRHAFRYRDARKRLVGQILAHHANARKLCAGFAL